MSNDMTAPATAVDEDRMLAALFAGAAEADSLDRDEAFVSSVMHEVDRDIARTGAWTTAIGAAAAVFGVISLAPMAPAFIGEVVRVFGDYTASLPVSGGTAMLILTMLGLGGAWFVTERA
jgi:hypothetical protein